MNYQQQQQYIQQQQQQQQQYNNNSNNNNNYYPTQQQQQQQQPSVVAAGYYGTPPAQQQQQQPVVPPIQPTMTYYNPTTILSSSSSNRKKRLKIVILGDSGVGKTCFLNRYSTNTFTGQYKATIGADFITKECVVTEPYTGQNYVVTLQIWDTAGQERFQSLGVGFYRGADAAILMYDITDPASLDHLQHWKTEFLEYAVGDTNAMINYHMRSNGPQFPFVVVGNKYDKDKKGRKIPFHRAEEWCRTNIGSSMSNTPYYDATNNNTTLSYHFETSAKTGWNVDEVFTEVAKLAFQYEDYRRQLQPQLYIPPAPSHIDFRQPNNNSNNNDKCC